MDVYDCVRSRLTVRKFNPNPVPETAVNKILEAARWAPSSRNLQPWHFIVIRDPETLTRIGGLASTGSFVARAPLAIAIVMVDADSPELDAGRALQQMELVAWSEGLGTCFVSLQNAEETHKVKELLGIPADAELITVMPFGYRTEEIEARGKRRKPLSAMVHKERF
ncbi:MAG: nitroreductase family protein [Dehalococcoidia bacterium]